MHTKVQQISSINPEFSIIQKAASILRSGGVVAFPTETVYGLGADALNPDAIQKVFKAKGRPADNPLIVHITSIDQLFQYGRDITPIAIKLAESFMPGPITLVVRHSEIVPRIVTAGLDTVALRMPNHTVPLSLVKALGHGIVGPSANRSGKPSPTTANHVLDDMDGKIEMILDAGETRIGIESTVLDTTSDIPIILRPGGITREQLESVIGQVRTSKEIDELRRSPGTRHRHYAPKAEVILIEPYNIKQFLITWDHFSQQGRQVRALIYSEELINCNNHQVFDLLPGTTEGYSHNIFAELRRLDQEGAEIILIESVLEQGLGVAVMDRLRRAAEAKEKKSQLS